MKDFFKVIGRFIKPYTGYLGGSVILNVLSAIFNIFSFTIIIPVLKILFNIDGTVYSFIEWGTPGYEFKDIALNNAYYYVTTLIENYGASKTLIILGGFLIVMTLLKTACYFGSSAIMMPIRTGIVRDVRNQLYGKILALPMGFFSSQRKGDIMARMTGDVGEVENSITGVLDMLIKNPILVIFYFATLIYISWELSLFTILVVPLMAWGIGIAGKKLRSESLDAQRKWGRTLTHIEETLGGLRIVKAFVAEDKMRSGFANINEANRKASTRVAVRQSAAHPLSEFLGTAMVMVVLWFGGTLIISEKSSFDAPTFIFYLVILYSVLAPIKEIARSSYLIPRGLASMERIDEILNAENNIREIENPVNISSLQDKISIRNLTFSYNGEVNVLSNINLEIKKGTTVALVGQSGSGKTTLVDLIPRYWDAQQGGIYFDDVNIKDASVKSLRSLIGNVNQDAILFNDTIFNNIAFGVENATMDQVVAAAKIANAHDFIMEKELGYNSPVGDRGCLLSGGQRQRISIARAILKNPSVLILDEATSALDTESERLVQEALDRLTADRTTIAIAHRLSTIKNADLICVLQNGRIAEQGTHSELIAKNGLYTKLYTMQSL